jgi:hypothetical protein
MCGSGVSAHLLWQHPSEGTLLCCVVYAGPRYAFARDKKLGRYYMLFAGKGAGRTFSYPD